MQSAVPAPADSRASGHRWRILAVLLTAIFMSLVNVSIVNVALPSIQQALHASVSDIQWVLSGYALTFGVVLVAAGRAGDLMGRGGFFLVGVGIFTASAIAAGLAPDVDWLNAARFLQGVGSGFLSPQALGMIQHHFRGNERGRAFGFLGTAVGISVAIGPVLGGLLIEFGGTALGWRLTFLINVPFGILALVLGLIWFPKPLFRAPGKGKPHTLPHSGKWRANLSSLDPVGALLLGLAVLAVLLPFVQTERNAIDWLLLPASAVLAWLWLRWERWYAGTGCSPMVDLNIFRTPSFRNGSIIMTLYFLGMTSVWVLVALYVQIGYDMSALQSGLFGVPSALLSAMAAHWAGKRVHRWGRKVVIGGLLLALFGLGLSCTVVWLHGMGLISIWWLVLALSFIGIAQGSIISPNQTLTLADVPIDYGGSSGAVMQTGQRIGTSVGIAMITATVFATQQAANWDLATIAGLGVIAVIVVIALFFAFLDLRQRSHQHVTDSS